FSKDFVLLNRLASTLFKRAQLEPEPATRDPFLLRAVDYYERTLSLDSEDLDAHYGLSQCYAQLGQGATVSATELAPETDEAALNAASAVIADARQTAATRLAAAAKLKKSLDGLAKEPIRADRQRRPRLELLLAQLRPVFQTE